ncbi:hypothetical protein ELH21_10240 [Rhizobium leguminosarum]|nr:hypothetical protein ELH21_10240 [Rhizobium leguminosarum]
MSARNFTVIFAADRSPAPAPSGTSPEAGACCRQRRFPCVNQHRTLTPFPYPILTPLCCRSALGLPGAGRGCRG